MSGFSPDWLALREPADHAARDAGLVAALARALPPRLRAVDLGCGTGSNLRALAPHLGAAQDWVLVDHDPALLAAAKVRLAAWAERAEAAGDGLVLQRGGARIAVRFRALDLAADPATALAEGPDLVTAAALFDLASESWIATVAGAVARAGAVFYTALTYDGQERWTPPHPADAAIHAAFLVHQAGDKGFGPASGPARPRRWPRPSGARLRGRDRRQPLASRAGRGRPAAKARRGNGAGGAGDRAGRGIGRRVMVGPAAAHRHGGGDRSSRPAGHAGRSDAGIRLTSSSCPRPGARQRRPANPGRRSPTGPGHP